MPVIFMAPNLLQLYQFESFYAFFFSGGQKQITFVGLIKCKRNIGKAGSFFWQFKLFVLSRLPRSHLIILPVGEAHGPVGW